MLNSKVSPEFFEAIAPEKPVEEVTEAPFAELTEKDENETAAEITEAETEVYFGTRYCKTYMFTIKSFDAGSDLIQVQYENGNTEYKSYSATINNKSAYVKG